ncbi:type II toxin-antitoxin system HicA family toxin [Chromobacterium sp. S0633]|uniref:type II toxin-antitoxin system HicA family toxin n=1 Tax=Chromobacterium sp. S0633 TaxID=2957805 RepID=UPI00209DFA10|nr:type II toxin-antitoxin system HicA family toxin [Chromobacterium sp. S0633]MCP1291414.1 type II toxin-antitoxin system HicA family toxin [Chromobacterium sp. S0633]
MMTVEKTIGKMRTSAGNISFDELVAVCDALFGEGRVKGSHHIYKIPGVPGGVNIQDNGRGKAKAYQVKQVLKAIEKIEGA